MMPPPGARAPSAASASSYRENKQYPLYSSGVPPEMDGMPTGPSPSYGDSQQTPQPLPHLHGGYANAHPQAFLPPVSSSPPPQPPQYVPPPQHAMPPDPIHSMMVPPGIMPPPPWVNPPGNWRGGPGYKVNLPNGHPPNPLESYPVRMGGTPVGMGNSMLQQAIMSNGHRSSSAQGEVRERRRRDRDEDGEEEVITTIFVVGFPDDMQEREFQNIFTFSPGFEAATLKFPSGSARSREPTAAFMAELQQLAANQQSAAAAAGEYSEIPIAPLEDALAALQMSGTASTSTSTTPSAAVSLTPSAPSGPMLGQSNLPTRRQTIGFARFKTRSDALAAREHLQGRKIDILTGATLKAEMAKKNLHTKRAPSGEELVGMLLRSGRLAGLMGMAGPGGPAGMNPHVVAALQQSGINQPILQQQSINTNSNPAKEAWDSWPNNRTGTERDISMNGINVTHQNRDRSASEEKLQAPFPAGSNFASSSSFSSSFPSQPIPPQSTSAAGSDSNNNSAIGSPPLSVKSPNSRPTDSKALLALAEEADELEGWSVGAMAMDYRGPHQMPNGRAGSVSGNRPYGMGISSNTYGGMNFGSSPPGGSDHLSDAGRSMGAMSNTANPADQNPPINTLYVGNLPAISPPTHPPNFLEESLRALFQVCAGFKRMSFRQKINGPMCFVEFEDVPYATSVIKELYGHTLGGLVKGGIRLSYSKNSLGQRGAVHPAGVNSSMFGGIAHTVALAGMSSPSTHQSPTPTPNGLAKPYQPVGIPNSIPQDRLSSEVTALSPTAQPFNATLPPLAASPRSRYFGSSSTSSGIPVKDPSPTSGSSYGFQAPSMPPSSSQSTSGFSPVSSPIRTPASFSWVSSGNGYGHMGMGISNGGLGVMGVPNGLANGSGAGGNGYEGYPGSLNGAATAWSQSQNNLNQHTNQ